MCVCVYLFCLPTVLGSVSSLCISFIWLKCFTYVARRLVSATACLSLNVQGWRLDHVPVVNNDELNKERKKEKELYINNVSLCDIMKTKAGSKVRKWG